MKFILIWKLKNANKKRMKYKNAYNHRKRVILYSAIIKIDRKLDSELVKFIRQHYISGYQFIEFILK